MSDQPAPHDNPPTQSLPPTMVGRPFGVDEAGKPINRNKGVTIRTTVEYMLDCVGRRAAQACPPEAGDEERAARVAQARSAAFDQLIQRLNAAIPDARYHVSREYLLNDGNAYSVEFDVFNSEICREIAGEPRFHFSRGAKSISPTILALAKPFSLRQVYGLLPRFAAKFADTDFRVVRVGDNSAIIQWRGNKELGMLPPALHQIFLAYSCQYIQGTLSNVPSAHSGLPMAEIHETRCQLRGDECCEWEFTWQAAPGRSLLSRLPRLFPSRAERRAARSSDRATMWAMAQPAAPPPGEDAMPPLPEQMEGLPFGTDPAGRPIKDTSGAVMQAVVEYMHICVKRRVEHDLPPGLDPDERADRVAQAQARALDQLIEKLNRAIPDHRYHVSKDYLLDSSHYYSHEFNLYVNEFAREVANDPTLFFQRGLRSIPSALVQLGRPLSIRRVYSVLPRLTAKVSEADMRVVQTTPGSAVIQWHPDLQLAKLPANLHKRYVRMACQAYQGAFAVIPTLHSGLPLADIKETHCILRGDDYCEWEFIWVSPKPRLSLGFWASAILSLFLAAYVLLRQPGWSWLALAAALGPFAVGWFAFTLRSLEYERDQQERMLQEQRDRSEEQYDSLQQANANLQVSNIGLEHKISEQTALREIGLALSATLDLDELLDTSLRAVTTHLSFDRAMIMLVDEDRRVATDGHAIGGSPQVLALIKQSEFSLDDPDGLIPRILASNRPLYIADARQEPYERSRMYLEALGTRAFLAVPLVIKGKTIGFLGVDNAPTGRAIPESDQELLQMVGRQIASAVDSARLYQTLERRVEQRTAELAHRAMQMQTAAEISRAASSLLDLETLLQQSVELIRERFELYYVGLFLLDDQREHAWLRAGTGEAGRVMQTRQHKLEAQATSMVGWCIVHARARIAQDTDQEAARFDNPLLPNTRSEMALPLVTSGQVIGALTVQSDKPRAFAESDMTVLQTMADQLANAIGNARLYSAAQLELGERKRAEAALQESQRQLQATYQREQERRRLSDTLREVAKIVSSTLDQRQVLDLILAQLGQVVVFHHATVMLLSGDELNVVALWDQPGSPAQTFNIPVGQFPLNVITLQDKRPMLIPDVRRDDRWQAASFTDPIRSFINAPLMAQNRPIGLLGVGRSDEIPYTEEDAETVFAFASQVAVALASARLHEYELAEVERELAIARQIQLSLLPANPPDVSGLDIASFAEAAQYVGGDFYNYFVFDSNHIGIALGDVSGKGIQGALMMALSFGLLANQVRREVAPAALLTDLNQLIQPHTQRNRLNTALCYLTLEWVEPAWRLRVANAGVIAPLLWDGKSRVTWLDAGGLPLGALPGVGYDELDQILSPGHVLLLSSDGVVEAMNARGELYGFERLEACVTRAPCRDARELQERILADVRAFSGRAELNDDLTMVVVRLGLG